MANSVTSFFQTLAVQVNIGTTGEERARKQRILIDAEYDVPIDSAGGDRLEGHIDYDAVRREIERIAEGGEYHLQETLCRKVLDAILAQAGVTRTKVRVAKPDIYPHVDLVGVIMERRKG
jgi:dihydroneopterin aldolase